jgi:glycerophosphoryl diester phosphodiesterase
MSPSRATAALLAALIALPAIAEHQLGPRPYYLVNQLQDGELKSALRECVGDAARKTDFAIGHRGAALQFPEHTRESYMAAARMGAGIMECDVTFTKDRQLVCRHSQCDLHTTTDILARPQLAAKCSEPFVPAQYDAAGNLLQEATARCCTSDITLAEFKSLCGKMDARDTGARTPEEYLGGTADWRTDLYATCGTVMSHKESIRLFQRLEVKFTPELKSPSVNMPFQGDYSQEDYARQMIDEYKAAGVSPAKVYAQSFNLGDILYWIAKEPEFGRQAVFLDERMYVNDPGELLVPADYAAAIASLPELKAKGVNIVAPPMWVLVERDGNNDIVPSEYAVAAREAGMDIITWTLERSGPLANGGGWYYQTTTDAIDNDGDTYELLDVLARDVGIKGIFSDWPATVTFYANCFGL